MFQYQFCVPNGSSRNCTELTGMERAYARSSHLGLNTFPSATVDLFYSAISVWQATIDIIAARSPPNPVAQETAIDDYLQLPPPNNQWTIEVQDWHATGLANFQLLVAGHATGQGKPEYYQHNIRPNNTAEKAVCHAQKIRLTGATLQR